MAKRSGSKKGTPFEREIAKELSWWWSWGERDDLVWRTASSGGRATQRCKTNQITKYQHGDFCPMDACIYPFFDFFLHEAKRGYNKTLDILESIDLPAHLKKVPMLRQWKETAERDRDAAGRKEIMIIFQRDGRRKLVAVSNELMGFLLDIDWNRFSRFGFPIVVAEGLSIYRMADFFSMLEPKDVYKLLDLNHYK